MKRNCSLEEISDGRIYHGNDMVRADCNGCKGCSACCKGMGDSVILDPLDVWRLRAATGSSFEQLMAGQIGLGVYDGVILPHLMMCGADEHCAFLGQPEDGAMNGRCLVHAARPGLCRLFPLGRVYENGGFGYILQTGECRHTNRSKVKVSKWLDTPKQREYDAFVLRWHSLIVRVQEKAAQPDTPEEAVKALNLYILKQFYFADYTDGAFFHIINRRLEEPALMRMLGGRGAV